MNNNIINELFNAPANWEWDELDEEEAHARFMVENIGYQFNAYKIRQYWKISFENQTVDPEERYKITGSGNSSIVFATVLDIIKDFKRRYNPELILFSAEEPSRKKLYLRLAKTVFPEYDITVEDVYIQAKKKNNISESEINRADVKAVFQGASELRNNPGFTGNIKNKIPFLKKDKIDVNDLQQVWKDEGFPDDTRDIYAILKSQGFADKEIKKVFAKVFGEDENDETGYIQPKASPAIQKIVDYAKKTGIKDELIKFMQNEFGEELGLVDNPGIMGKVWNVGKKLYKKAMAEEVRQIFTEIIQEERTERFENIRQIQKTQLGRIKK